jgi:hypothetical protein
VDARSAHEEDQSAPDEDRPQDREERAAAEPRADDAERDAPADPTVEGETAIEPGYEPL